MSVKKCLICGQEFETARPNKKYCSLVCRESGAKLRRMKWNDKNPRYSTDYMQKYRKEKREKEKAIV